MEQQRKGASSEPLLESPSKGTASTTQTLGNIIVSVVGTGVLGLPFAFRIAGWFAGLLGVFIAGSLSALAPFSIIAGICNVLAIAIVVKQDIQQVIGSEFSFRDRTAITSNIGELPFAAGMAVFCFEGFGMTLALEASMKDKSTFPKLLAKAFTGITLVYAAFGFFGYMAYGDQTKDIAILNLPYNWSSLAVEVGLCLGIIFTFPIMLILVMLPKVWPSRAWEFGGIAIMVHPHVTRS
uniref:Amino acid transporter transmembrane domain-containing protein n=1 Tax=Fagus sylvatica TaxID=28930 RepID=A0A2N9GC21_FAGSY